MESNPEEQAEPTSESMPEPEPETRQAIQTVLPPVAVPIPAAVSQTKSEASWLRGLRMFLQVLVRLIIALLVGASIGLLLFVGVPWLNDRFIVPLDQNTQRLNVLEADATERLDALEAERKVQEQQITDLLAEIENLNETLETNQEAQAAAQEQVLEDAEVLRSSLAEIEQQVAALETGATVLQTTLDDQQGQIVESGFVIQEQATQLVELGQEISLLQAMGMLSRARLFLLQNNLGMAELEVEAARETLTEMRPELNDSQAKALDAMVQRLDQALHNLDVAPVLVVDDLEVAWQLLRRGLVPLELPQLEIVITVEPIVTETTPITPTLTLEPATPTPTPSP